MERVCVLINKLQEQLARKADIQNMLVTTQLLQAELLLQSYQPGQVATKKVAVIVPYAIRAAEQIEQMPPDVAEPVVEVEKPMQRSGTLF